MSTAIGTGLAIRLGDHRRLQSVGIGFAAGVMVVVSLTSLLPEAAARSGPAATCIAAVAGASVLAAAHFLVPHRHLVDESNGRALIPIRVVYLVALGLILHDFPEGYALANAYELSPRHGIVVALAILARNIPEEYALALPAALDRRWRFLAVAAVASAAAEPAGAILGLAGSRAFPGLTPILLLSPPGRWSSCRSTSSSRSVERSAARLRSPQGPLPERLPSWCSRSSSRPEDRGPVRSRNPTRRCGRIGR